MYYLKGGRKIPEIKYKDEKGEKYKISWSEELQLKNLKAARENTRWLKMNFYAKVFLAFMVLVLTVAFLFLLFRLDRVDFFTTLLS